MMEVVELELGEMLLLELSDVIPAEEWAEAYRLIHGTPDTYRYQENDHE